mmetsp:Transcript_40592/g.56417  ORF Transcript_40592/g.56417 Transcript_40592/m.56417 type:complete len:424 (+) Transcript_40592:100-1371(+)
MLRNIVMMTWFLFCWILAVQAIWDRYEIDALEASNDTNFMNGADGIDFADFNEDGHDDAVICYEESGFVSAFLYPGKESVQEPWPEIQISNLSVGAEMSIWVDADGDGCLDVCVTREGDSRVVEIFWCDPQNKTRELWPSNTFPDAPSLEWMTAVANDVNRDGNMDIVIGSKKILAEIGWLEAPSKDKRNTSAWTYHKIAPATWIMSLFVRDMDGDGEEDLAVTDRQGLFRWFQYPGAGLENGLWPEYPVGQRNEPEGDLTKLLLFGGFGDVNGDGATDAVAATDFESGSLGVTIFYRTTPDDSFPEWGPSEFLLLPPSLTKAKAANPGDLTLDGKMEIAFSCEVRGGENHCVGYFVQTDVGWEYIDVSGSVGQKFDDIILRDIDLDGDLDMVTCEEVDDLGVIWYKNPRNIFFEGLPHSHLH